MKQSFKIIFQENLGYFTYFAIKLKRGFESPNFA